MKKIKYYILTIAVCFFISLNGLAQITTTIAGTGTAGPATDDVIGTNSAINSPYGIDTDAAGNVYFADQGNNSIRKIDAITGIITSVYTDNVNIPNGIAVTDLGDIYFTANGQKLMKYNYLTSSVDVLTTLTYAGLGLCVSNDSIFIAYGSIHKIGLFIESTGVETLYAGTGTGGYNGESLSTAVTQLNTPTDVEFTVDGDLLVCDKGNSRIRKINRYTATVTTIVGSGLAGFDGNGILAVNAKLNLPEGIDVATDGTVYISDSENNMIRKINPVTFNIELVAGTGSAGFNDGDQTIAQFNVPALITVDYSGNIYVSDYGNQRIRKIQYCSPANFPTVNLGGFENGDCPQELYLYLTNPDLNDNQKWVWYENSCGNSLLGEGDTLIINPLLSNVFYVRGEGGTCGNSPNCSEFNFDSLTCNLDSTNNFVLTIPSAFSPNNDGVNETFIVEGIDSVSQNKVYIYNRWGDLVYFTQNYNNVEKVWNGINYLSGERVSVGTFFYVIESNEQRVKSGWVQVIR